MNTTTKPTFEMRPVVYALVWRSDWAGDVPGPQMVAASWERTDLEDRRGETTYDGVSARTQGTYRLEEFRQPKSIATLIKKGADIDVTADGGWVGCWFDGKPWMVIIDEYAGFWKWRTAQERDYLEACRLASGFPSPYDRDFPAY